MVTEVVHALARISLRDRPLEDVLREITDVAREVVPSAERHVDHPARGDKAPAAAYSGRAGAPRRRAAVRAWIRTLHGCRPDGLLMHVADMAGEARWPDYSAAVLDKGVRSSVSTPLPYQGATIGALNVYSGTVDAFSTRTSPLATRSRTTSPWRSATRTHMARRCSSLLTCVGRWSRGR